MKEIRKRRVLKKELTDKEIKLIAYFEERISRVKKLISEWKEAIDDLKHEWQEYTYDNFVYTPNERQNYTRRDCQNVHGRAMQLRIAV